MVRTRRCCGYFALPFGGVVAALAWAVLTPVASCGSCRTGCGRKSTFAIVVPATQHAARSLRVALGNSFMPLSAASRVRQLIILLLVFSVVAGLLALQASGYGGDPDEHTPPFGGINTLLWAAPLVGAMMAWGGERVLRLRWARCNAELPLLALLPGLGDATQVKRALLRASLGPALSLQVLLLVASVLLAVWWHLADRSDLLLLLIGQLADMGLLLALVLAVFGGTSLRGGDGVAMGLVGSIWFTVLIFSAASLGKAAPGPVMASLLAVGWATFAIWLLWCGRRGWRGLERRPHPFLSS